MPASRARTHRRLPSPHRVKIHRNYTIGEAADLLGKHKNTVREWIRCGLPALTEQRPTLILGSDLRAYLTKRRKSNKQPCRPGELYCLRCRAAPPAGWRHGRFSAPDPDQRQPDRTLLDLRHLDVQAGDEVEAGDRCG
ncbi:MAG: helix-turn-helix domain-containing protein [Lysobacterales bacterium]